MQGEKNLELLLKNMSPKLNRGEYVFCSVQNNFDVKDEFIIASFNEEEGKTLVLKREVADKMHFKYHSIMSWITLNVYSSLKAVGFTAKVSAALAGKGISCNIIAAYYHDHIFVNKEDSEKAIKALIDLCKK